MTKSEDRIYHLLERVEMLTQEHSASLVALHKDVENLTNLMTQVRAKQDMCEARKMYSAVGFLGRIAGLVVALGLSILALVKSIVG